MRKLQRLTISTLIYFMSQGMRTFELSKLRKTEDGDGVKSSASIESNATHGQIDLPCLAPLNARLRFTNMRYDTKV